MKVFRFISTIIAVTLLTAIILLLVIVIANLYVTTPVFYTLMGCCLVAGISGAVCELLENQK